MKKNILLFALFATTIITISCKKNSVTAGLEGTWELRKSYGGFTPDSIYAKGIGNKLIITSTQFTLYQNNMLKTSATYTIAKDSLYPNNILYNKLVLSNGEKHGYTLTSDTLTLDVYKPAFDGRAWIYVKL